ncbi:CoA ester lyase [Arthrobacter sp. zg-Y20]|uniref:HpcH/HpaI aldolase/citrate lyase family protein n=2 Tax=Arthrobacter TaxID=1663 RepID=UPI001D14A29C|nr:MULTISPECIES: aldolase/citrate lyase family protein [unclassified Arthrobacter]MCC3275380.1 CoA ester lyase [Arthrobacter sp. zg-Y20]MDK1315539.1 aldolase/citrate lyase family protein [Arthrobacter sp. zg.Y20]
MSRPVMVALYAPADRPERFAKALQAGADAVIVDLEDAVAASRKDAARAALTDFAACWEECREADGGDAPAVQVRVNARGSRAHDADLAAVAALPPEFGVRLPKTQSGADVAAFRAVLPGRQAHALLESALSIERAFEIAGSGVASIAAGEADLRAELGIPAGPAGEAGLAWPRSRIINAAAAAGLPAPLMAVYAHVRDVDGLAASCRAGRALGFAGRTAVHPRQIEVIRRVFTPDAAELARAQGIVERVQAAARDGSGAFVLADGTFLDVAMLRAAERVLALGGHSTA